MFTLRDYPMPSTLRNLVDRRNAQLFANIVQASSVREKLHQLN